MFLRHFENRDVILIVLDIVCILADSPKVVEQMKEQRYTLGTFPLFDLIIDSFNDEEVEIFSVLHEILNKLENEPVVYVSTLCSNYIYTVSFLAYDRKPISIKQGYSIMGFWNSTWRSLF